MINLILGDSKEKLKDIKANSIDSCVCDPPAGINFMGADFDTFDKSMFGRKGEEGLNDLKVKKNFEILPRYANSDLLGFQDYICEIFIEVLRVLKPGSHALVWAIPRTSHHTAMGLERAGFEVRQKIYHVFGQGFPKSMNISKAIDKQKKAKREVIGMKKGQGNIPNDRGNWGLKSNQPIDITIPNTDEAKYWEGWGTDLKPAVEEWILIRKPLSEKTIIANVLKHGTGGINIDACRIKHNETSKYTIRNKRTDNSIFNDKSCGFNSEKQILASSDPNGRFPSNFIIDCTCEQVLTEPTKIKEPSEVKGGIFSPSQGKPAGRTYKGGKKIHTNSNCPCYILDKQSGIGASHFFYTPKASTSERNKGCEYEKNEQLRLSDNPDYNTGTIIKPPKNFNIHPTVKSLSLMRYLIKLITPKKGIVLDCFMGSGSTGVAAKELGFNFIGIEKNDEYFHIAEKRINNTKEIEKGLF